MGGLPHWETFFFRFFFIGSPSHLSVRAVQPVGARAHAATQRPPSALDGASVAGGGREGGHPSGSGGGGDPL